MRTLLIFMLPGFLSVLIKTEPWDDDDLVVNEGTYDQQDETDQL